MKERSYLSLWSSICEPIAYEADPAAAEVLLVAVWNAGLIVFLLMLKTKLNML